MKDINDAYILGIVISGVKEERKKDITEQNFQIETLNKEGKIIKIEVINKDEEKKSEINKIRKGIIIYIQGKIEERREKIYINIKDYIEIKVRKEKDFIFLYKHKEMVNNLYISGKEKGEYIEVIREDRKKSLKEKDKIKIEKGEQREVIIKSEISEEGIRRK